MTETKFQHIKTDSDIKEVVKSAFDLELDIDGGWGYDRDSALVINKLSMPLMQLQHTLASMRAHLEMNMTLAKDKRYGAINLNEIKKEEKEFKLRKYDIITFEVTAMPEDAYAKFIAEYKEGQESDIFNIKEHFERRKKKTLVRELVFWFDICEVV